uniref:Gustatory receptor n=1 Tax=Glossina brevipalpis TaxID=37001 RepID=A0A1A9X4H7_9MUSC
MIICFVKLYSTKRMNSLESQFYEAIGSLLMISKILICAPIGLQKPPNQLNHYLIYQKCLQIVWSLIIYVAIALGSYHEYFVLQSALSTVEFPFYLSETVLDILQLMYQLIEQTLKQTLTENVFHVQRKLRVLRGLYADMEDYIKHLNETFSISILLRFMASLSSLIKLTNPEDIWAAFSIIEICMQFSRIFLILHFNQGVQYEKKRAAVLFTTFRCIMERLEPTLKRNITFKFIDVRFNNTDEAVYQKLVTLHRFLEPINRFIMQLSAHPRNHIIYGIIPLNMNIMMTMFVVVSTLFIFLVQYDITYEALMNAGKRT